MWEPNIKLNKEQQQKYENLLNMWKGVLTDEESQRIIREVKLKSLLKETKNYGN